MKLSALLLLLSTLSHTEAFFKSHDIVTHDDGSVHLFEKTQHRRLSTKNLKTNSDAANTKFTVHGSEHVTQKLHVDGIATVGGLEFENLDETVDVFGPHALSSLAGAGLSVVGTKLTAATHLFGTTSGTSLEGNTTTISDAQASAITTNTAKVSMVLGNTSSTALAGDTTTISAEQALAIVANTVKTVITSDQASAITTNTAKVSMVLGNTSSTALAGDTTTISADQASAIVANTVKTGITSEQASAITTNTAKTGVSAIQASAITANTAKPDPYRLEKMVLLLCNTLGIKFEHLERAVDGTFDPYERFGAIQVNDDELYSGVNTTNKIVDVTTATTAALCSTKTDVACPTGLSNKHALARCAATCVASDYGLNGGCCAYD